MTTYGISFFGTAVTGVTAVNDPKADFSSFRYVLILDSRNERNGNGDWKITLMSGVGSNVVQFDNGWKLTELRGWYNWTGSSFKLTLTDQYGETLEMKFFSKNMEELLADFFEKVESTCSKFRSASICKLLENTDDKRTLLSLPQEDTVVNIAYYRRLLAPYWTSYRAYLNDEGIRNTANAEQQKEIRQMMEKMLAGFFAIKEKKEE